MRKDNFRRGSFAALRRTAGNSQRQVQGQQPRQRQRPLQGSFASLRMTARNGQRQVQRPEQGQKQMRGSFASLRMTARNGQLQRQQQGQTRVLRFAQDDSEEKGDGGVGLRAG